MSGLKDFGQVNESTLLASGENSTGPTIGWSEASV